MSESAYLPREDVLLAQRLVSARLHCKALATYPGEPPPSLQAAYVIQDRAIDLWPDDVAGWKIGLIQPGHRAAHGGVERIAGPIFCNQIQVASAGRAVNIHVFAGGFAAVEAEFIFRLGADAPPDQLVWSPDDAAQLVDAMLVGVELAGSPFAGINDLGPAVTASDFGNNAGLVVGAVVPAWRTKVLSDLAVETFIDGLSVGRGSAADVPGGPLAALGFALGNAASRGRPLRAGALVSTGAVTGVHPIRAGQTSTADFGPLGAYTCHALPAEPTRERRP